MTLCLNYAKRTWLILLAMILTVPGAVAQQPTPTNSAAAQPILPGATTASRSKPDSPVVEEIARTRQPVLHVHRRIVARPVAKRHHAFRHRVPGRTLERPALAGVELVAPLPAPGEPPHVTVPAPAFPLESVTAAFLTPPPPIVCFPTRRDRTQPDAHIYKETTVQCEPDNP